MPKPDVWNKKVIISPDQVAIQTLACRIENLEKEVKAIQSHLLNMELDTLPTSFDAPFDDAIIDVEAEDMTE